MGTARPQAVAGLLALLLSAPAVAFTPYSEIRQEHPVVGDAVAAMPSSGIEGPLNHLSALLEQPSVAFLGAGDSEALPPHVERGLTMAILALRADLHRGVDTLDPGQAYVLLQVVDVVAFRRPTELYQGWDATPCIPTLEGPCPPPRPQVLRQLDSLAESLRTTIVRVLDDHAARTGTVEPPPGDLNSDTFGSVIDLLKDTYGLSSGVESIDYQ